MMYKNLMKTDGQMHDESEIVEIIFSISREIVSMLFGLIAIAICIDNIFAYKKNGFRFLIAIF